MKSKSNQLPQDARTHPISSGYFFYISLVVPSLIHMLVYLWWKHDRIPTDVAYSHFKIE